MTAPETHRATADRAYLIVAAAALLALAAHFFAAFVAPPLLADPGNGTPWSPHSDALGPWLHGGLAYHFGITPPNYLYRPTVGLFWGSILGAGGRIELIPAFFIALLFATIALALRAADRPLRGALAMVLLLTAISFGETWASLSFDIDLAALALTVTGILLVLHDRGGGSLACLLAGCVCLGIAAAIRGPLMIAGPIIIALRMLLMERPSARLFLVALAMFALPIAIDVGSQRYWGIPSNMTQVLFCVATDPSHGWTPACKDEFWRRLPSGAEVLRELLAFRLSAEGRGLLLEQLSWRTARDLWPPRPLAAGAIVLACAALASGYREYPARSVTPFVRAVIAIATLYLAWRASAGHAWTPLGWIVATAAVAAALRNWRALACIATYLTGIVFLAGIGLNYHDRLVNTFGFMLPLGVGLLVMGGPAPSDAGPERRTTSRRALAAVATAAVLFLYCGGVLFGGKARETFHRDVYQQVGRAIKVGDDARVDRSLYYSWAGALVYTRHDGLAIGEVRRFREFALPHVGNKSFAQPNAFVE